MLKMNLLFLNLLLLISSIASAQRTYEIDASNILPMPRKEIPMSGINPQGGKLSVNSRYFEKDGKPWFPLMGELHFNRVPETQWDEEILKMKNAGLSVIATYIFWNEHETAQGVWDWKANRDLRKFINRCASKGMYVWLRIGPWSHGEQLYGGFPQWIENMKGKRRNAPEYLAEAKKLYQQISQQAKGTYFKDGGPVIGVQLENEYAVGQAEHISELKRLAQEVGIDPVFWTVTANTVFDETKMEVLPLQGSYCYRGWEKGGGGPTKDFLYGNDQWIMTDALGKLFYDIERYPRGLCEQGCGSQMTYTNRFIVEPHIVEAHLQNQIGRGMNLVGYYMFHGGTQTPGLKEPGCPESYDFQAPIGEFGFLRPSYRYLKILHQFVADFGSDLAQMQVVRAPKPVVDERNTSDLRYISRVGEDGSGYLFLCNAQVRVPMTDKKVQLKVHLKNETIEFPVMNVKRETSPILPFNFKVNDVVFKYITAQPFARLNNPALTTVFFVRPEGVKAELAIDKSTLGKVLTKCVMKESGNCLYISLEDNQNSLRVIDQNGKKAELIFLSRIEAENAWKIKNNGTEMLMITQADVQAENGKIELRQMDNPSFSCFVYPDVSFGQNFATNKNKVSAKTGFARYDFNVKPVALSVDVILEKNRATVKNIPVFPKNVSDIVLKVDYRGGTCIAKNGNVILTDNLFNGDDGWMIGLKRYKGLSSINFEAQQWNDNITGVSFDKVKEAKEKGSAIVDVKVMPQYHILLDCK